VIAVFCIRGNGVSELKSQANVYTIGTNYWRSIQADFPPPVPLPHTCSTFVSGTINWFSIDNISTQVIIVSLDLETESYRELLQPDDGVMDVVSPTLHVLMDCLCISYHNHNHNFLDVWLMKEYGNEDSWTKLFRVPNMGDVSSFPYTRALHVYEDDIVLLQGFQLLLGVYNSRDGTFQTLEIQNTDSRMVPQVYQESLISPCS
jgi:F-box interacting protein